MTLCGVAGVREGRERHRYAAVIAVSADVVHAHRELETLTRLHRLGKFAVLHRKGRRLRYVWHDLEGSDPCNVVGLVRLTHVRLIVCDQPEVPGADV